MEVVGPFNALIRAGLRKDFRDEYDSYEPEYTSFLKTGTTDVPEVMAAIFTGISRMVELDDGEPITYDSPKLGPRVAGVDKEFGIGVQIGRRILEDDQYGKMKQSAKWLAHAARMTYEYRSAAFLDDAFSGNTFKGYDGLSWCNTAHTFLNNQSNANATWSNALANPVGFSMSGVTAMLDLFGTLKDHNGDPIKIMPDVCVIGNNAGDIHRAMLIFGQDAEPYTADRNDNVIKKRLGTIKPQVSRFKSSLKSYFLINNKYNDAQFLVRRPVKVEDDFDFNTAAALFKATTRFLIWGVDSRGWVGSNPS